jgi:hypothetical protein
MINRIRETVKTFLNTDGRGNFSPSKFDTILHYVVNNKFEELFFEVNRQLNRQNRGLINGGLENLADKTREKIEHYLMPDTALTYAAPYFQLPANLRYFDSVEYNGNPVELCKSNKEFKILQTAVPTTTWPIGVKIGNVIKIDPSTIVGSVTVSYLRNPVQAKWTYTIIDGVEVFNPSALDYVDVDIHPSEEDDIIIRVLQGFGVELKEQDIQQLTQADKLTEFQQEQQS